MGWVRRLQLAAFAVFIVAYSLLSHYGNSHADARGLATALALLPLLALALLLAWRLFGPLSAGAVTLLLTAVLWHYWPQLIDNYALLFLLQQFGFCGLLAATFGITLMRGRTPLCTLLADKVHGPLNAVELRYTRQVTAAWALFFLLELLVTVLLYEFASLRTWSLFANFGVPLLIALMFVGEYAVRRRVLPTAHNTGGLMATLRVYFVNPRGP